MDLRQGRCLGLLLRRQTLQISFLVLLNVSLITMIIIYGHVANEPRAQQPALIRESYAMRSAHWQPLVRHFQAQCRPRTRSPQPQSPTVTVTASASAGLYFVKTHKTGGSTLANILLRQALAHGWPVCLPVIDDAHMGWPRPPSLADVALPTGSRSCRLVAHHALFRPALRRQLFPRRPFTFALARDPLRQLKSALFYFAEIDSLRLPARRRLDAFLSDAVLLNAELAFPGGGRLRLGRHLLATELGFERRRFPTDEAFLTFAESSFDLVGVTENFTASLVLLRRLAGLPFTALTFTQLNRNIVEDVPDLEALRRKHRAVNELDYRLYDLFVRRLQQQIAQQPHDDFAQEVRCVTALNRAVWAFCMHAAAVDALRIPPTRWSKTAFFHQEQCADLHMLPRDLTPLLRARLLSAADTAAYFLRRWTLRVVRSFV